MSRFAARGEGNRQADERGLPGIVDLWRFHAEPKKLSLMPAITTTDKEQMSINEAEIHENHRDRDYG
jgi:hypothetical protein